MWVAVLSEALRPLATHIREDPDCSWGRFSARQAFDHRYGDRIVSDGKQAVNEMQRLAQELASAAKMLDSLA